MNIPILIVAAVMSVAILGHVFIGTRETATLEPRAASGKPMANWVQTMCAFQMLTIDLIVLTAALYWLALGEPGALARPLTLAIAGYFALQGLLWLGHILWFSRPGASLLTLPHWAVWLGCAALLWWGA
ncbi:MAG: hypothetical protein AAF744_02410 [Pseudomonadota bacterium]